MAETGGVGDGSVGKQKKLKMPFGERVKIMMKKKRGTLSGDKEGSKDETFFDPGAWFDSDCDDFLSVNEDFSRGNSLNSNGSAPPTPRPTVATLMTVMASVNMEEPSPTDKKKKLSELFKEPTENGEVAVFQSKAVNIQEVNGTKSGDKQLGTEKSSGATVAKSETVNPQNGEHHEADVSKSPEHAKKQCCIPIAGLSFKERKRPKTVLSTKK